MAVSEAVLPSLFLTPVFPLQPSHFPPTAVHSHRRHTFSVCYHRLLGSLMPAPKLAVSDARNDTLGWPFSRDCLVQAAAHLNWRIILSAAWPAVVFAWVMLLPYLNKAFLVDDAWFVAQAQHVLRHPLQPTNFDICWFGNEQCGKSWSMASGPALGAYLVVPAILAGGAEWVAHLIEMFFAALAIVSMTAIALRLGWDRHGSVATFRRRRMRGTMSALRVPSPPAPGGQK